MKQLVQFWLSTQCMLISGSRKAIVLLGTAGKGPYTLFAEFPGESRTDTTLLNIAQAALARKRSVIESRKRVAPSTGEPLDQVAWPLFSEGKLQGVVAVEMSSHPEKQQQEIIRQLQDGAVWLTAMMEHQEMCGKSQLISVVELVALCLEHQYFQQAVTDVVSDMALRYSCEQVTAGFLYGRNVKVTAISNSAQINERTPLVAHLADALQEAVDQEEIIEYPSEDALKITRAHVQLAEEHGCGALCTIPFAVNGEIVGGFLFELPDGKSFDPGMVEFLRQVVLLAGPVLEMRRKEDRPLITKAGDAVARQLGRIFGPGHLAMKFFVVAGVCAAIFFSQFTSEYQIVARATLEPVMQRVVVASLDGYIADSTVMAGDLVTAGEVLATLEDKDLKLERQKYFSQLDELNKEYADALARHDRSQTYIIKAQIAQVEARIDLVDEQLSRTRLTAPFDGLVVRGDLRQALGSPVERGQVLFEVAPVDSYQVIVQVDQRDIGDVSAGKRGKLILSGMPGEMLFFTVKKITPVSAAEDGRNFFRVEAELDAVTDLLRPGMAGIAKIAVEQRKLIWIWTHEMVDWLRIHTWMLLP